MRATLEIIIDYDTDACTSEARAQRDIKHLLYQAAQRMAGEGLLSGNTDLSVDSWRCQVTLEDIRAK